MAELKNCPVCGTPARMMVHDGCYSVKPIVPRWIPVEEMMPEGNDDVIVFVQDPINGHCWTQTAHHVSTLGFDECVDDEWWIDGSGETVSYITHWMPLPEPPEEERRC